MLLSIVDSNLIEHVGQRLASELQHIFHLHGQIGDLESKSSLLPRSRKHSTASEAPVLNLGSPISMHFPPMLPQSPIELGLPGSAESTPLLTPHISPSASSNASVESLLLDQSDSSEEPTVVTKDGLEVVQDPYGARSSTPVEEDLSSLRAASARAAYCLPPRPRFLDIDPFRRSRSHEEIRKKSRRHKQRSPSTDFDEAWKTFQNRAGVRTSATSTASDVSDKRSLRSVRSILKNPLSVTTTRSPSPLPPVLTRKSLSSGINLDTAFNSDPRPVEDEEEPQCSRLWPRIRS